MVNTFLIYADFYQSAMALDFRRLGKQRVEAYQLLNNLLLLEAMAKHLNLDIPGDKITHTDKQLWIKQTYSLYLKQPWRLELDHTTNPYEIKRYYWFGNTKKVHGYLLHPVTALWLGYTDALMAYLNAHIMAFMAKGGNNTMLQYAVPIVYARPAWCDQVAFHTSHRQALLAKELGNNRTNRTETPHYQLNPDFAGLKPVIAYDWVPDLIS